MTETHSQSESLYSVPPPPPPPPLVWLPQLPSQQTHLRDREKPHSGGLVQWAGQPTSEALSLKERSVSDAAGALCPVVLRCLHALDTILNATGCTRAGVGVADKPLDHTPSFTHQSRRLCHCQRRMACSRCGRGTGSSLAPAPAPEDGAGPPLSRGLCRGKPSASLSLPSSTMGPTPSPPLPSSSPSSASG